MTKKYFQLAIKIWDSYISKTVQLSARLQGNNHLNTEHARESNGNCISFFSEDLSFEDHPKLLNDLLIPFWFLSSEIRETLTSPAWKDRVAKGQNPFFCFHDGFCRYFDTLQKLREHLAKNPTHSLSSSEMARLKRKVGSYFKNHRKDLKSRLVRYTDGI